jgi:RNA polymerase sigma-70 factor (ECF subfamily)
VFRARAAALHAFAYRLVQSRAVAEDVVQEAVMAALRSGREWESERALAAYLFTAARSRAIICLRHDRVIARHAAANAAAGAMTAPAADEVTDRASVQDAVQRAIDGLPERSRLVLLLSRYTDLTYAEIAQTLGISVKTVESHLDRAFRRLRVQLAPYWPLAVTAIAVLRVLNGGLPLPA